MQRALCCGVFFLLGGANSFFDQQWPANHYRFERSKNTPDVFRIALNEPLRAERSSQRFYGKVLTLNKKKAQGKILVQIDNDRLHLPFRLGDIIEGTGALAPFDAHSIPVPLIMQLIFLHKKLLSNGKPILQPCPR